MHKHPFRHAVEAGIPTSAFAKLFAPDAIIHAPMLSKPVQGLEQVVNIVGHAAKIAAPNQYTIEVNDGHQTLLLWHGSVAGVRLEAATILVDGEDGLIREVRVVMRSWPMVTLFRDAMYKELASSIPAEYWELAVLATGSVRARIVQEFETNKT
jgi:hypothetical protein